MGKYSASDGTTQGTFKAKLIRLCVGGKSLLSDRAVSRLKLKTSQFNYSLKLSKLKLIKLIMPGTLNRLNSLTFHPEHVLNYISFWMFSHTFSTTLSELKLNSFGISAFMVPARPCL